jgi:hypothetical protein
LDTLSNVATSATVSRFSPAPVGCVIVILLHGRSPGTPRPGVLIGKTIGNL